MRNLLLSALWVLVIYMGFSVNAFIGMVVLFGSAMLIEHFTRR